MEDGYNGIIIGAQTPKQWALVINERMNVEQAIITGVNEISSDLQGSNVLYDLNGQRVSGLRKGVNIVRCADGTTKKVVKR